MGICPFQNFWAQAHQAFAHLEISEHGQGFLQMPYDMPYIFGIFVGTGIGFLSNG